MANLLVRKYRAFQPEDRAEVLQLLLFRNLTAPILLDNVGSGKVPITSKDISAAHARQIESFGEAALSKKRREVWGELGETDEAMRQSIGRMLNRLVVSRDDQKLTLQTATELLTIPGDEVEETKVAGKSAMPDGLLQNLSPEEVRDLIGYLMSPIQVEAAPK